MNQPHSNLKHAKFRLSPVLLLVSILASIGVAFLPATNAVAASQTNSVPQALSTRSASSAATSPSWNLSRDGNDPYWDGCASSSRAVNNTAVYHGGVYIGNLALMWSTACKTNWARFTGNGNVGLVAVWVHRLADDKWCGDQNGNGCGSAFWQNSAYSNELYGCNYYVHAQVEIWNNSNPYYMNTPAIGGC